MRRTVLATTAFLLLGVVTTALVAWCAVAVGSLGTVHGQTVRPPGARADVPGSGSLAPERLDWPAPVVRGWLTGGSLACSGPTRVAWSRGAGLSWDAAVADAGGKGGVPMRVLQRLRAGWPLVALSWTRGEEVRGGAVVSGWGDYGVELPRAVSDGTPLSRWGWFTGTAVVPRRLPIRPEWVGLSVDSAAYAGMWAVVVLVPMVVVRRATAARRRRRGRCAACGYPVVGSSGGGVCPECGVGHRPSECPAR